MPAPFTSSFRKVLLGFSFLWTNPTATISVKAASLTSDISYNSSTSTFTVAPASGWNARTGGNLIVTMDASKSAGNYSGYVAISGGGASRVQVNISGTITEPTANPTLIPLS